MKRGLMFTALLLCLLLAAACTGINEQGGQSSESGGEEPPLQEFVETSGQPQGAEPLHPWGSLRGIRSFKRFNGCGTSLGYYEIVDLPEYGKELNSCQILYTDYTTRRQTVLCDEAACAHNNENCTGWLPGNYGRYQIFEAGGQMVLVRLSYAVSMVLETSEDPEARKPWPPAVFTMDYSGKNRQALTEFEELGDRQRSVNPIATNDEYVYCELVSEKDVEDADERERTVQLVGVSIKTGEIEALYEMDKDREAALYEVYGEELVTSLFKSKEGEDIIYTAVNVKTKAARRLNAETPGDQMRGRLYGEWLYYRKNTEGDVYRINAETGQDEALFIADPPSYFAVTSYYDGRVLYENWINEETGTNTEFGWMDETSLERHTINLFYAIEDDVAEEDVYNEIILPIATAGEYYLVDYEHVKAEPVFADTDSRLAEGGTLRALILKEDYWHGVPNFIPITMAG